MKNRHAPLFLITTACLIFAPPLHAAVPFEDSVPLEVVEHFLGGVPGMEAKLYRDLPADFPEFTMPANAELLAALDRGYSVQLLLRSETAAADALALMDEFVAAGWIENTPVMPVSANTGFVAAEQPEIPVSLCNSGLGSLQLSAAEDKLTLIHSLPLPAGRAQDCNRNAEIAARRAERMATGLSQYMPRLVMPPRGNMPLFGIGGFSSNSSSREASSRAELHDERPIDDILAHFREQIEEQGWRRDGISVAGPVATGTWHREVDAMELLGVLTVTGLGDDNYELNFRVVRQGGGNAGVPRNIIGR